MKSLIFLFFISMLLLGCDDIFPNKRLPPISQTGENTFGFKLDGEVWLPYYRGLKFDYYKELTGNYSPLNGGFTIEATREKDDIVNRFYLTANNIFDDVHNLFDFTILNQSYFRTHLLKPDGDTLRIFFTFRNYNFNSSQFYLNFGHGDYFTFTKIDTVRQIVSGEFELTLRNHDGRELKITEGRFDFNYPLSLPF